MEINRDLCIGQMVLGMMSHFDNDEIIKYNDLQYIAKILKKKNFALKNGTEKERYFANESFVMLKLKAVSKNKKKQKAILDESIKSKIAIENKLLRWSEHGKITDLAWMKAIEKIDKNNYITILSAILAVLRKNPQTVKFYSFSPKKLEQIQKAQSLKDAYIFSSSRATTHLLDALDVEIAQYNFRQVAENGKN